jgi:hypothetical protein
MTEEKKFQRTTEDFRCEKCGLEVRGNGYTNHCPRCLWSQHVDIRPGDRAEQCGGLMEPISVEEKGGEYVLTHKCKKCGAIRHITAVPHDNIERIIELSSRPV